MSVLTPSIATAHAPEAFGSVARCVILPSFPTIVLVRSSSRTRFWLSSIMSFSSCAIRYVSESVAASESLTAKRAEKSPLRTETSVFKSRRADAASISPEAVVPPCIRPLPPPMLPVPMVPAPMLPPSPPGIRPSVDNLLALDLPEAGSLLNGAGPAIADFSGASVDACNGICCDVLWAESC